MRLFLATRNFAIVDDLTSRWADVEVEGVAGSYTDILEAVARTGDVACAILDTRLDAEVDRDRGRSIDDAVREIRRAHPSIRLIVLAPAGITVPAVDEGGAELVVVNSGERSAANIAQALGLTAKADAARVIAVTGLEGGAGRTTIARAIAASAAERVGKPGDGRGGVLLWEFDVRRPTAIAFDLDAPSSLVLDGGRRTMARLLGDAPFMPERVIDAVAEAVVPAESARLPYDVLIAPYGIREILAALGSEIRLDALEARLREILAAVSAHYRVVVLDCPNDPVIDPQMMLAIGAADAITVVATPSPSGLSSVVAMSEILSDLRAIERSRLVLTKVNREARAYLAAINESSTIPVVATIDAGVPVNLGTVAASLLEA